MDWKMGRAHASTFFFSQYSHKEKEIQKRQADRQIKKRYRKKEKREKETKEHSVCGPWGLFLMYLLSQRRGGCTFVWMMVAPLSRARPSLQQSSFKSWTLKQLAGFCWPTNSRVIPDRAQENISFSLFYFTMRMTRRGVRGDNSFS